MVLDRLLGEVSTQQFLDDSFGKFPFSSQGGAVGFTQYATWRTVEAALSQPSPDIILSRQGERWDEELRPSIDTVRRLHQDGYTLMVRNSERIDSQLAELADGFFQDFQAPIDVQLYYTPGQKFGFGWHYDAEDVFILQADGVKEYSLRKNTVNPWPLKDALPSDMRYERETTPMMQCRLKAGDWLYIPAGYWHRAEALDDSISIAVGVMTTSAMDVLDFLRRRLLRSLVWRQRLPVLGGVSAFSTAELAEQCKEIFHFLGQDLQQAITEERFLDDFLASRGRARGES